MTSNGAEYRFWMYADTANENRYVSDTGSVFELRTDTTGQVLVYTKRTATGYAANAYTAVGTYAVGWTEYRVVLDFTSDTYTLSKRADRRRTLDAAEVRHGASTYAIPMREATDRTTTANLLFRGYTNADLWLDDVRFSTPASSTCSDPTPSPPPPAPAARSRPSGASTVAYGASQAYTIAPATGYADRRRARRRRLGRRPVAPTRSPTSRAEPHASPRRFVRHLRRRRHARHATSTATPATRRAAPSTSTTPVRELPRL